MPFVADLHIHSCYSRACSRALSPETLYRWAQLKGITVLATGDFTHPAWFEELTTKLIPAENGLFQLRPDLARGVDAQVPQACRAPVRFMLGVEISLVYKKGAKTRRLHHLVFSPSFDAARRFRESLDKIGNIRSDGRPILGLDSKRLLSLALDSSPESYLIPAHAWTPHFGLFGSESGFDAIEECFEDLSPHIFAIETGLSSDPPMNWRLTALDKIALISNSDAHSPEKLAREGNVFETELSYAGIFEAIRTRDPRRFLGTLEFFPEEGKYHVDGHRACQQRLEPEETLQRKGLCPVCGKVVTVGVLHRVEKLADRKRGLKPKNALGFENLIPLKEVIAATLGVGAASQRVDRLYHELLAAFGPELTLLRSTPVEELTRRGYPLVALALEKMRQGDVKINPGYDGEYGTISIDLPKRTAREGGPARPELFAPSC